LPKENFCSVYETAVVDSKTLNAKLVVGAIQCDLEEARVHENGILIEVDIKMVTAWEFLVSLQSFIP